MTSLGAIWKISQAVEVAAIVLAYVSTTPLGSPVVRDIWLMVTTFSDHKTRRGIEDSTPSGSTPYISIIIMPNVLAST